jgi:hypothetical protein
MFPTFGTPELSEAFMDFLKKALVAAETDFRVLEHLPRYTVTFQEAFIKQLVSEHDGRSALICFSGTDDLTSAKKKIGKYYDRVKEARQTRMLLVATSEQMFEPCQRDQLTCLGETATVPLLLIRTAVEYGSLTQSEVADYIRTSDLPFVSTRKRRDDETQVGDVIKDRETGEVTGMRASIPDVEDERPTLIPDLPSPTPKR